MAQAADEKGKHLQQHVEPFACIKGKNGKAEASAEVQQLANSIAIALSNVKTFDQQGGGKPPPPSDDVKQIWTAGQWVWKAGKWIFAVLAAGAYAGIIYQQFVAGNATKDDIEKIFETHSQDGEAHPELKTAIDHNTDKLEFVGDGVNVLVKTASEEVELKHKLNLLEKYNAEYRSAMAEYAADKSLGRSVRRPKKDPEHIQLEADIERMLNENGSSLKEYLESLKN